MFICRFVLFDLQESSKYLIAKHRDEEAIQVCHYAYVFNVVLNLIYLRSFNTLLDGTGELLRSRLNNYTKLTWLPKTWFQERIGRLSDRLSLISLCTYYFSRIISIQLSDHSFVHRSHVRPLFAGKRFAINSTIIILSWGEVFAVFQVNLHEIESSY